MVFYTINTKVGNLISVSTASTKSSDLPPTPKDNGTSRSTIQSWASDGVPYNYLGFDSSSQTSYISNLGASTTSCIPITLMTVVEPGSANKTFYKGGPGNGAQNTASYDPPHPVALVQQTFSSVSASLAAPSAHAGKMVAATTPYQIDANSTTVQPAKASTSSLLIAPNWTIELSNQTIFTYGLPPPAVSAGLTGFRRGMLRRRLHALSSTQSSLFLLVY